MEIYYGGLDNLFLWILGAPIVIVMLAIVIGISIEQGKEKHGKHSC